MEQGGAEGSDAVAADSGLTFVDTPPTPSADWIQLYDHDQQMEYFLNPRTYQKLHLRPTAEDVEAAAATTTPTRAEQRSREPWHDESDSGRKRGLAPLRGGKQAVSVAKRQAGKLQTQVKGRITSPGDDSEPDPVAQLHPLLQRKAARSSRSPPPTADHRLPEGVPRRTTAASPQPRA